MFFTDNSKKRRFDTVAIIISLVAIIGVVAWLEIDEQSKQEGPKLTFAGIEKKLHRDGVCKETSLIDEVYFANRLRAKGLFEEKDRFPLVRKLFGTPWEETNHLKIPECLKRLTRKNGKSALFVPH